MNLKKIHEINERISKKYDLPINCIIMNRSDHYPASYFRSSLFILAITYLIFYFIPFDIQDPIWMIGLSVPAVVLGQILALFPRYKKFFISNSEMKEECYQQALEQGYQMGVLAEDHSLYIYLSEFEKRVELFIPSALKETKISGQVKSEFKTMIRSFKKGNFTSALENFYEAILIQNNQEISVEIDHPSGEAVEVLESKGLLSETKESSQNNESKIEANESQSLEQKGPTPIAPYNVEERKED